MAPTVALASASLPLQPLPSLPLIHLQAAAKTSALTTLDPSPHISAHRRTSPHIAAHRRTSPHIAAHLRGVRVARGVDPRPSELTMNENIAASVPVRRPLVRLAGSSSWSSWPHQACPRALRVALRGELSSVSAPRAGVYSRGEGSSVSQVARDGLTLPCAREVTRSVSRPRCAWLATRLARQGNSAESPVSHRAMPYAMQRGGQPTLGEARRAGDMLSQAVEWTRCVSMHGSRVK